MLKSYLKTALRTIQRQKAYSLINLLGLSVGLACSFFILLWIQDEMNYDGFHEEGDQLYRVMRHVTFSDGQVFTWPSITKPLAKVLVDDYPEVTHSVLITWRQEMLFAHEEKVFRERGYHASPELFEIFSFPFVVGDPSTAMTDPYSVVLSESLAEKYFGSSYHETAIGQVIHIDNRADFTVTGVFSDVPENSTLNFDYVIPIEEYIQRNSWVEHWGNSGLRIYARLRAGADLATVNGKIKNIIRDNHEATNARVFLQPYTDIRLYSDFEDGQLVGGRIDYVRMFGIVAIFILLIASINFMNLATARSAKRAREIGVRKAVGASKRSLVGQFLGESVMMSMMAVVVSLLVVWLLLPSFNELTDKSIALASLDVSTWVLFLGIALMTGLLAGSYPALYLSSFNVISVLRSTFKHGAGGARLRKGLVVFQFAMSILLIIGTMTVFQQIDYIRSKNLGLDRENLVYMDLEGGIGEQYDTFKQELLQQPGIVSVTAASQNPLSVGQSTSDPTWEGKDPESDILFHIIRAHYDFVETMKMDLAQGRVFSTSFASDSVNYIVNERAVEAMGMTDAIGQRLSFWGEEGEIIGVVKDFHLASLYSEIEPAIIRLDPDDTGQVYVRTEVGNTTQALESLEQVYARFNPAIPFDYDFLDEEFEQTYQSEIVIGTLANYFAILAIFIACLGLFGLASFTAEQRTKEVGIRKVLGASVGNLVMLLSRDFVRLVLVAYILALPIAYFVMQDWLSNFAYHVNLGVGLFALAGIAAFLIAALTVSYQSLRAAVANPVDSLRIE